MSFLRRASKRLVNFLAKRHDNTRLQEEIEAHLAALTEENLRAGISPAEATRHARLKFGSVEAVRADQHDEATLPLLEDLRRDGHYALRGFWKSPAFTLAAVCSLMLGIGANTFVFGLIDSVLLRPLVYLEADRLVQVQAYDPKRGREAEPQPISYPRWELIRDQQEVFADLTAATASGDPSKPPTLMFDSLPASFSAAIAPSAISSLPLITPVTLGLACSRLCILSCPWVRSQLATCDPTFLRSGYWVSTVPNPLDRVAALLSDGDPSSST